VPYNGLLMPLVVAQESGASAIVALLLAGIGLGIFLIAVLVVPLEAFVLWVVLRLSPLAALRDSVLVNLASILVGVVLAVVVANMTGEISVLFLVSLVASIFVELALFRLIHREPVWSGPRMIAAVVLANLASYALLAAATFAAFA
jgi:hypothetical protein